MCEAGGGPGGVGRSVGHNQLLMRTGLCFFPTRQCVARLEPCQAGCCGVQNRDLGRNEGLVISYGEDGGSALTGQVEAIE